MLRPRVAHLIRVVEAPRVTESVDAVLVSHLHWDHLDVPSLRRLRPQQIVVPRGAGRLLARKGFQDVVEVDVDDEVAVGAFGVRAVPAEHDGRRHPLARRVPALGFVLSGPARIYFAGDTDVFAGMAGLAPLDCALVPVAGWGPRVGAGHLDPRRAAEALRLLEPRLAVPIHWGTYVRAGLTRDPERLRAPAEELVRRAAEVAPSVEVRILDPGERLTLPG